MYYVEIGYNTLVYPVHTVCFYFIHTFMIVYIYYITINITAEALLRELSFFCRLPFFYQIRRLCLYSNHETFIESLEKLYSFSKCVQACTVCLEMFTSSAPSTNSDCM